MIKVITLDKTVENITFNNLMACLPELDISGKSSETVNNQDAADL
jgi:hypothetical protein